MNLEQGTRGFDPRRLPEFAPDPALWSRIVAAQQRRASRRRWQRAVVGGALAASIAAALLVGVPVLAPVVPSGTIAMQDESRALEDEWRRLAGTQAAALGSTRLRAIDAELQAAYDRGAATDELSALWQQRNRALQGLIAAMQDGAYGRSSSITQL
ncbi:MAG: hypothetical protein ACTHK2_09860 [Dokdonella sp.]|uniref:hypothetical protein n=1 Tax=Dokdonella sp. TaxID=2291710 RepID=UPI003F815625